MIFGTVQLHLHDDLEENVEGLLPEYPCLTRLTEMDGYVSGFLPWHWHGYFECLRVEKGTLELIVENGTHRIEAGDGCFINADVLHCFRPADGQRGVRYHVHQFSRDFIGGLNLLDRKYVVPVSACGELDVTPLSRENARQARMLSLIEEAYVLAGEEPTGYEMRVRTLLCEMWLLLLEEAGEVIKANRSVLSADSDRIKGMLTYIENNFSQDIGPRQIAADACLSVRECHRCFQKVLGVTPQSYINDRRISESLKLLCDTADTVTQIASACGFSTSSYFAKRFKDKMGRTPLAYRRESRGAPSPGETSPSGD